MNSRWKANLELDFLTELPEKKYRITNKLIKNTLVNFQQYNPVRHVHGFFEARGVSMSVN